MQQEIAQAKKLISDANTILVVWAEDPSGDSAAAGFSLAYSLRKLGKKVHTVPSELPPRISFLAEPPEPQEIILAINTKEKEIEQLKYEKAQDALHIRLALRKGHLQSSDVSFFSSRPAVSPEQTPPNLIITIGVPRAEQLNTLLPPPRSRDHSLILNIDAGVGNEQFGHVNLISPNAIALSEVVYDILSSFDANLPDEKGATALLTGIICATRNFSHPKSGPLALKKSAQLLERGADHQMIMRAMYKSKPLDRMRLFGRALERVRSDLARELLWTTLRQNDFEETKTDSRALPALLEEFRTNFWQFPSYLILWESHGSGPVIKGLLSSQNALVIEHILTRFEGGMRGKTALFLVREHPMREAEKKVLQSLASLSTP